MGRLILGLGLLSMAAGRIGLAATDRDPWRSTGLDFGFVREHVETNACYRLEARFLSCLSAVQHLLEHAPRNLRLALTVDLESDTERAATVLARFGPVAVLELSPLDGSGALSLALEVRSRVQRIADWRWLYRSGGRLIDFTGLRDWLLSQVVDHDRTAAYAAAAINGYLSVADAHAKIVPTHLIRKEARGASSNAATAEREKKRYTGIGVALEQVGTLPVVTALIAGSPAALAGLRTNDVLVAIDGEPFRGSPIEETLERLRGPVGAPLTLQFRRGRALHSARLQRQEIVLHNVTASVLRRTGPDWGYLRVNSFVPPETCAEARRELDSLIAARVSGLVLDLRNNAGGRLDQALCAADLFLGPGLMVLEIRSTTGEAHDRKMYTRFGASTHLPLVTLVNAGTGSASEILAGALRDHRRSLLVGERTFGKGTVQTARPWDASGSIMKFSTAARFYLPSGRGVQRIGLYPDLDVPQQPADDSQQQSVLRLEDLYPTTPPADADAPSATVASRPSNLTACLSSDGEAPPSGSGDGMEQVLSDYPVYRATTLLSCML